VASRDVATNPATNKWVKIFMARSIPAARNEKQPALFQTLELFGRIFPRLGKIRFHFSKPWKSLSTNQHGQIIRERYRRGKMFRQKSSAAPLIGRKP
jgi:hypothetical protein